LQSPHVSTDYLEGSVRVVALIGEHDLSTREAVLAELERVGGSGIRVIVDLTDAEFIDSSVLSVLIAFHKRAESTPGTGFAVVVSPGTLPDRLFELTTARSVLATFASRDDAIRGHGEGEAATIARSAPAEWAVTGVAEQGDWRALRGVSFE
jgi:anti-anti-sigma factor